MFARANGEFIRRVVRVHPRFRHRATNFLLLLLRQIAFPLDRVTIRVKVISRRQLRAFGSRESVEKGAPVSRDSESHLETRDSRVDVSKYRSCFAKPARAFRATRDTLNESSRGDCENHKHTVTRREFRGRAADRPARFFFFSFFFFFPASRVLEPR